MHNPLLSHVQRQWIISLLLVAVVTRALIPAGFMPSAEQPFTFQICPDGFPAQLLHSPEHAAHHHVHDAAQQTESQHGGHDHNAARAEHCVFAAAASAGPAPQTALLLTPVEIEATQPLYFSPAPPTLARYRVQQPRGPPALS